MWKVDWAALRKLDWQVLAGIGLRNLVPVVGMIVSGFGAGEIVLLYYVDTLAGLATVFALMMLYGKFMQADGSPPLDASKPVDVAKIVFSAGFLTVFFGLVCAMPLVIAAAMSGIDWTSEQLRVAVLVQLLFASTEFLSMSREIRAMPSPDARLKARFAFVFLRWIAVFAMTTTFPWPPLLVLTYVVASIWLEARPLDAEKIFPSKVPAPTPTPAPTFAPRKKKRR